MIQVNLKPIIIDGIEYIGIFFAQNSSLKILVGKIKETIWSETNKCWYIPLKKEAYIFLQNSLKEKATIDTNELKKYLENKKQNASKNLSLTKNKIELLVPTKVAVLKGLKIQAHVSSVNKHVLANLYQHLILKAYSPSTIRTYMNEMSQLLAMLKDIPADELKTVHLKRYFAFCFEKLGLSENTLHSRINALKFYYEQVLGREKFFWEIPRPKKPFILPRLLNETELAKLFNALTNKKHKAIMFTAYSAGLRVSEIVNLKIADIDSKRMQILVKSAKGKKDRYVNLSPVLLDILRSYIKEYKPRPKVYLFESEQTQTAYPTRTIQQIFSNAKQKAGIRKEVGIHSLRHSFATHLLDKGTDIRYIKDLLGHFNIKTTERYLHVSRKQLVNIISPFDDLWKKENLEW